MFIIPLKYKTEENTSEKREWQNTQRFLFYFINNKHKIQHNSIAGKSRFITQQLKSDIVKVIVISVVLVGLLKVIVVPCVSNSY